MRESKLTTRILVEKLYHFRKSAKLKEIYKMIYVSISYDCEK